MKFFISKHEGKQGSYLKKSYLFFKRGLTIAMAAFLELAALNMAGCTHKQVYKHRHVIEFLALNSDLGILSDYQKHFNNGVKMAVKEINSSGGINGAKVVVKHQSDYLSYAAASAALQQYQNSNILACFGTFFDEPAMGVAKAANIIGMPFLSSAPNDYIINQDPGGYVYRLRAGLDTMITALAKDISGVEGLNSWLVIMYNNQFSQQELKLFKNALIKFRLQKKSKLSKRDLEHSLFFRPLYIAPFRTEESLSLTTLSKQVKGTKGVLILTNGYDLQALQNNLNLPYSLSGRVVVAPFAGDPEWLSYDLKSQGPTSWLVSGYPWYSLANVGHKNFVNRYIKNYGLKPRYASLLGYQSVYILAQAARAVNTNTADIPAIRRDLAQQLGVSKTASPLGIVFFNPDHSSNQGVFTGLSYIYSQKIKSTKGSPMLLKDIRMQDITYWTLPKLGIVTDRRVLPPQVISSKRKIKSHAWWFVGDKQQLNPNAKVGPNLDDSTQTEATETMMTQTYHP